MEENQLLRFLAVGSVDDSKSTLIGRLLYDTHSIYDDQFAGLRRASAATGSENIDLSFVTDGLRAEREQRITIDVGYRSFSTAKRRFLIADAPGHEHYTRNMATAASSASVAVLLIDASKGASLQTHRHATIAWLLGIRRFVVSVNKMDLVGFGEETFRKIEGDFSGFVTKPDGAEAYFIPTCLTAGDNVVTRSTRIPWFEGMTLLEYLENTSVSSILHSGRLRLPLQFVIRTEGHPSDMPGRLRLACYGTGILSVSFLLDGPRESNQSELGTAS